MSERTLVGVPFYEQEGQECLDITLRNIDRCLAKLAIDASIIVRVNGPDTASGARPDLTVNHSNYNAEVELQLSDKLSQARAMDDIIDTASDRNIERIFLTDADIFRFTDSLGNMWDYDATIVGARYRPYPIEIVEAEFGKLTYEERLLYQIFDGDQLPQVRHTLAKHGIDRRDWVKASLMLVDVERSKGMHAGQNQATDSVMNRMIDKRDIQIAPDAFFMHMGRVDMTDHIKARIRHFKAADTRGELDSFLHKEVRLPDVATIDEIANDIRDNYKQGDFYAMLYLTRSAIREKVNEICMQIVQNNWNEANLHMTSPRSLSYVATYEDAKDATSKFFVDVNWDEIKGYADSVPSTTQEKLRQPFDVSRHLADYSLAKLAIGSFMIDDPLDRKVSHKTW